MIARRAFCKAAGASALLASIPAYRSKLDSFAPGSRDQASSNFDVATIDRQRILSAAQRYLSERPVTITSFHAARSAGKIHDYFSEGDYWWPDPANPGGGYIQRDGMSNPDNFVAHRHALIQLSVQMPALTAAFLLTGDERYAASAVEHLSAWFVEEATRMNPNLQYAQAIQGRFTGRGIGIIDTLQLVEVARAASMLEESRAFGKQTQERIVDWFAQYLQWMTTSQHGLEERDAKNNHGTCWVLQVAQFAKYVNNASLTDFCRTRFKTVLVPNQIAANGRFPEEQRRTKPYGYSLFNLDVMAAVCQVLSTNEDNLWNYQLPDGRGLRKAMQYMFPYITDKTKWPLKPDVQYFEYWPVRHPSLLFAGQAYKQPEYLDLWRKLNPDPTVEEIIRNFPVRQPALWLQ